MALRDYSGNAVPTTITAGINSTDLSISIASATGWPAGGAAGKFYVTIDRGLSTEERVLVASRSGTTLTVAAVGDRGVDNTSAASHTSGATIEHTFSGVDADEANAHINDTTRDDHTQYLNNARHDVEARHQFGAALGTPSAPADVGTVAAAGTGDDPAREDHVHIIGAGAINSSAMFGAGVVDAAAIAAGAVGSSELATDSVSTDEIAALAVGTAELADNSVTNAKMADNAVNTAEIVDNSVTNAKMADNSVGAAEIIAAAVGTSEIADANVTLAKIASEAGTNYTPTLTNVSLGTGSKYGRYFKLGRMVVGVAGFTLGSGGNVTGTIQVSLPFAAAAGTGVDYIGAARGADLSASTGAGGIGVILAGESTLKNFTTVGSDLWNSITPWNWDDGDTFRAFFFYEAAA